MNNDLKDFMERALGDADGEEMMRICIAFAELALHYREMWMGVTVAPDDNVSFVIRTMKAAREAK